MGVSLERMPVHHVCYPHRPEEGARFSGIGVTDGSQNAKRVLGTKAMSSTRAARALSTILALFQDKPLVGGGDG